MEFRIQVDKLNNHNGIECMKPIVDMSETLHLLENQFDDDAIGFAAMSLR